MLSKETEKKLVEIFIILSLGEEKINKMKQNIFGSLNINPIKLFFSLDLDNLGYLSKKDFYSLFKFFSINFTTTEIDYIFFFYDKNEDDILNFNEFIDLIISDSNYFYKKSFKKKYKSNKFDISELKGDFRHGIEKAFLELLMEEICLAKYLNALIIDIKKCIDFGVENLFYEIKSYSYITKDSLKAFFDRNEIDYDDKFIKNIFNRFNSKDINGKIVYNKFKKFFDLSNNNYKQIFIDNNTPNISQTFVSGDIKYDETNNNDFIASNTELDEFQFPKRRNTYNKHNYNDHKNNININEDDIQFKCGHLNNSGSVESFNKELKKSNCKYIPKGKKKNNIYRNYLREKRSKSLEKSLKKTIKYIKPVLNEYKDFNNYKEENYFNINESSFHEDLPIKLNIRLDKNLVKRQIPKRNIQMQNNNKTIFNFRYADNIEDIKINRHRKNYNYIYLNHNDISKLKNSNDICYNCGLNNNYREKMVNEKYNKNDMDLKLYNEDITYRFENRKYYPI